MPAMVVLLQSERLKALGIPHGFSTRDGGVSLGPYASLNVARAGSGGDDPAAITQNMKRSGDCNAHTQCRAERTQQIAAPCQIAGWLQKPKQPQPELQ